MTEPNYQVFLPGTIAKERTSFAVKLDEKNENIRGLYETHRAKSCAFLTAFNPGGRIADPIRNLRLQSELFSYLADLGLTWFDGAAVSTPTQYEQTPCALVMGVDLAEAESIARQFNQAAFVFAGESAVPELVRTTGLTPSPSQRQEADLLDRTIRSDSPNPRRDLLAMARMYGVEATSADGLVRLLTTLIGSKAIRPDLVPAVFGSPWQRLGEQLETIYADHPDEFILEVGHRTNAAEAAHAPFNLAASFSMADVRNRFERRRAPRSTGQS